MYFWNLFIGFFISGGPVMWPILAVSLVVWAMGLKKMSQISRLRLARKKFHAAFKHTGSEEQNIATGYPAYDALLKCMPHVFSREAQVTYRFREFLLKTIPDLDQGFSFMSAWISVAPLLGLLGTVSGMIKTFEIIQVFGIGNPHMMSEGISIALLTTQAGLTAAFPGMLLHNFLVNSKNRLVREIMKDGEDLIKMSGTKNNQD